MELLSYLFNPEPQIGLRDLARNRRQKKAQVIKKLTQKKRSRGEEFTEEIADFYNPTSYFLKNAPGASGLRGVGLGIALDLFNDIQDAWRKL